MHGERPYSLIGDSDTKMTPWDSLLLTLDPLLRDFPSFLPSLHLPCLLHSLSSFSPPEHLTLVSQAGTSSQRKNLLMLRLLWGLLDPIIRGQGSQMKTSCLSSIWNQLSENETERNKGWNLRPFGQLQDLLPAAETADWCACACVHACAHVCAHACVYVRVLFMWNFSYFISQHLSLSTKPLKCFITNTSLMTFYFLLFSTFIRIELTYDIVFVSGVQHNYLIYECIARWLP